MTKEREGKIHAHAAGRRKTGLQGFPSGTPCTEAVVWIFPKRLTAVKDEIGVPIPFAAGVECHVRLRGNPAVLATLHPDAAIRHVDQKRAGATQVAVAFTGARLKKGAYAFLDLLVEGHVHRISRAGPPVIAATREDGGDFALFCTWKDEIVRGPGVIRRERAVGKVL